jgi:RimJ/RimL family protein N-acetyltransferase
VAAVEGDRPVARAQLAPVGTCGHALFAVGFQDGLSDAEARRAADVLARHAVALARGAAGSRYLEMDVPEFAPLPGCWRSALEASGVPAIAETVTYALEAPERVEDPGGLALAPVETLSRERVVAAYEAAYADTTDRSHRSTPESFATRFERLTQIQLLTPDRGGWLVATEAGAPVGLVFASLEQAPFGRPDQGWIVEIGVAPGARGRGLSARLLAAGVGSLARSGARRVVSRIDVENVASVKLHRRAGFEREPGASWMHRAVW